MYTAIRSISVIFLQLFCCLWRFNTPVQKKVQQKLSFSFLADCSMTSANPTVSKHSSFCQRTLESTEDIPLLHVITDSFLKNIVAVLLDPP